MCLIPPRPVCLRRCLTTVDKAGLPILLNGERGDAGPHAAQVQESVEVVDLLGDEPGEPSFVDGGDLGAVEPGGGGDAQGAGDQAADV
jgi:hypothetical protein